MHLLGHHLPDHKLMRIALKQFYGISQPMASRLLARLQIPELARVNSLTEPQVTALSAYLSSPSTSERPAPTPVAPPATDKGKGKAALPPAPKMEDPLDNLRIETDLRRARRADIQHHRQIGTYRGRRHAMGLPVRGQNTQTNARTARRLNHLNRRAFSTSPNVEFIEAEVPKPPSKILQMLGWP